MIKLKKPFSLYVYVYSNTAESLIKQGKIHRSEQYEPDIPIIQNLMLLHNAVILPCLNSLKGEIYITSGFRCDKLNEAVGGSKNSQHKSGQAVDVVYYEDGKMQNRVLFDYIKNNLDFDQLIWEKQGQWVHVSYKDKGNRKQVLNL